MNCHNGEKYLDQAIKSLKTQTYKNWELIFFDNCSKDYSKKIIKKENCSQIKYFFSEKKLKLYHARNLAIKKAKGEYIAFLDTDDKWEKDKLKYQINFFKKNVKYKIVYSNYFILNDLKKNKSIKYYNALPSGKISQNLINNYVVGILTVMIKRDLFKKYKFNEKFDIIGDFDLIFQLSQKYMIGCIQKPLASYRLHSENYSKKVDLYLDELNVWISKNKKKFLKNNYDLSNLKYYIFKLKVKKFLSLIGIY